MSKHFDRALESAKEYRRLCDAGRFPEAEQVELTICDLVGHPIGKGRVEIPEPIAAVMGRADLAAK